jgi:hypothetical protein
MKFNHDYFYNSKISNYKDYAEQAKPKAPKVAWELAQELDLVDDYVLDYGCAEGYLVEELNN